MGLWCCSYPGLCFHAYHSVIRFSCLCLLLFPAMPGSHLCSAKQIAEDSHRRFGDGTLIHYIVCSSRRLMRLPPSKPISEFTFGLRTLTQGVALGRDLLLTSAAFGASSSHGETKGYGKLSI